jgi:chitodextrinase
MAAGTYRLALWLPDQATGLRANPAYSVRFANTGTWDAAKGYNVLANAVTVGACGGDCVPPTAPTLAAPTVTGTSVSLSWSGATDGVGVTAYRVFRDGTPLATVTGTSYVDTGAPTGQHTYTVTARDAAGNESPHSNGRTVGVGCTDCVPPSAPTGLTVTATTPRSIALSWNAATDNVGVTGYRVYEGSTVVATATGTSTTVSGLAAGSTHTYTVAARDAAGNLGPARWVTVASGRITAKSV